MNQEYFIQRSFIRAISNRLKGYNEVSNQLFNFRCPICGDSKKSESKKRFYMTINQDKGVGTCHNCGWSGSFQHFLEDFDAQELKNYRTEVFKELGNKKKKPKVEVSYKKKSNPVFKEKEALDYYPTIKSLSDDHETKKYVQSRMIPEQFYDSLYYVENFKELVKNFRPDKDVEKWSDTDKRLVIPFCTPSGKLYAFQGRTLTGMQPKYVTIKATDESPKIFGLDRVDVKKEIRVLEGPIDGMFVHNSVGTCDSSLWKFPTGVLVWDNEPRNREVVSKIRKGIKLGRKVVIWPRECEGLNDINDMVLAGVDVNKVIQENTFEGLKLQMLFDKWRCV